MTINFRQPKYIIPLLALPFLILFFYVYQSSSKAKAPPPKQQAGINTAVGEVSDDIKKKQLADKLDAYRSTYKEADGFTAVSPVPVDKTATPQLQDNYSARQKKMLDSINTAVKQKFNNVSQERTSNNNATMIAALNHIHKEKPQKQKELEKEKDPMELFKQQMAVMDSLQKANDPEARAEAKKQAVAAKQAQLKASEKFLTVHKADDHSGDFNTVRPESNNNMIMAVIDENVTGYAGSRIRLKLLENIEAGGHSIEKGTYLYALINGFSEQRVTLQVRSIFYNNEILPVKLDLYDTDGLPGLYVPSSAFRDFTKDLGTNTVQGVTLDGSSSFVMSTAGKMFQSTSSAIAGIIRKDKAKLKYNSHIYLIDSEELQQKQKNY